MNGEYNENKISLLTNSAIANDIVKISYSKYNLEHINDK